MFLSEINEVKINFTSDIFKQQGELCLSLGALTYLPSLFDFVLLLSITGLSLEENSLTTQHGKNKITHEFWKSNFPVGLS